MHRPCGRERHPRAGEQPPRSGVRRVGERLVGRRSNRLLGFQLCGLHEAGQHGSGAVDVSVHRDACRTQQATGRPVGADRLHDHRFGLCCDDLRHHPRGSHLQRSELGGLGGVGAEVAGDEHPVDLLARQQRGQGPGIGHRVPLPRPGKVDRVAHGGARPELPPERVTGLRGEHWCLQTDRGQGIARDRAVPSPVSEDRDLPASHPTPGEQALQQIRHLRGVVDPVGSRGGTGRVDHLVGAGQRSRVRDGTAHGGRRATRRHQQHRLARGAESSRDRNEGATVHDVLGVDRDSARRLVCRGTTPSGPPPTGRPGSRARRSARLQVPDPPAERRGRAPRCRSGSAPPPRLPAAGRGSAGGSCWCPPDPGSSVRRAPRQQHEPDAPPPARPRHRHLRARRGRR